MSAIKEWGIGGGFGVLDDRPSIRWLKSLGIFLFLFCTRLYQLVDYVYYVLTNFSVFSIFCTCLLSGDSYCAY